MGCFTSKPMVAVVLAAEEKKNKRVRDHHHGSGSNRNVAADATTDRGSAPATAAPATPAATTSASEDALVAAMMSAFMAQVDPLFSRASPTCPDLQGSDDRRRLSSSDNFSTASGDDHPPEWYMIDADCNALRSMWSELKDDDVQA
jgi:hypothetical protein